MWLQRPKHQRQRKTCYPSNTQLQTYVEQKYIHFNIQRHIRNHCSCSLLYERHTSTLDSIHSQRRGNTSLLQGCILWGQNLRFWPVCLCPTKHFGQRGLDGHIAWNADNPYPLRDTQIRFKSSSQYDGVCWCLLCKKYCNFTSKFIASVCTPFLKDGQCIRRVCNLGR